jgi:hypothetical protein
MEIKGAPRLVLHLEEQHVIKQTHLRVHEIARVIQLPLDGLSSCQHVYTTLPRKVIVQ